MILLVEFKVSAASIKLIIMQPTLKKRNIRDRKVIEESKVGELRKVEVRLFKERRGGL